MDSVARRRKQSPWSPRFLKIFEATVRLEARKLPYSHIVRIPPFQGNTSISVGSQLMQCENLLIDNIENTLIYWISTLVKLPLIKNGIDNESDYPQLNLAYTFHLWVDCINNREKWHNYPELSASTKSTWSSKAAVSPLIWPPGVRGR